MPPLPSVCGDDAVPAMISGWAALGNCTPGPGGNPKVDGAEIEAATPTSIGHFRSWPPCTQEVSSAPVSGFAASRTGAELSAREVNAPSVQEINATEACKK